MRKNDALVDKIEGALVDKNTEPKVVNLAFFKETKDIADILTIINGKQVNLGELYNEMWVFDKDSEQDTPVVLGS